MVEALLLSVCLFGSQEGCMNGGQGYYKYSGLEAIADKIGKEYPVLPGLVGFAGTIYNKNVSMMLVKVEEVRVIIQATPQEQVLVLRRDF